MKNVSTPRLFIAATRQNDGKTTTSLGLLAALKKRFPRVGYIKPVGQRFVEIEDLKIDEDTVLMDSVYKLNCPLNEMNPIAILPNFTRRYLEQTHKQDLALRTEAAFDRVAWEKDFVLCEGSGHAGVGAVFDFSNARVARTLQAKVIIVSRGGIGQPIDEVTLNQALFEKEGVEVIGVILNKVLPGKLEDIKAITQRGFRRKGLELLGVIPYEPLLALPSMDQVRKELHATPLNDSDRIHNLVDNVVVGAMGVQHVVKFFRRGSLVITPGDREDIILAAGTALVGQAYDGLAGLLLTGGISPPDGVMDSIQKMPFPVLLTEEESYQASSIVHDLTVKTSPNDKQKIDVIRELVARHVDVDRILQAL